MDDRSPNRPESSPSPSASSPSTSSRAAAKPARRSTADVDDAVFEAIREELAEVGYQRLTMVGVARRAGTSRRALYLRWTTKDQMIYDAIVPFIPTAVSFVSSGDLRTDLIEFLPQLTAFDGTGARAIRSVVAEAYRDPDSMVYLSEKLLAASWRGLRQLLLEAIARGEADPASLDYEIMLIVSAVIFHQLVTSAQPISKDLVVRLVDRALLSLVQSESYAASRTAKAH